VSFSPKRFVLAIAVAGLLAAPGFVVAQAQDAAQPSSSAQPAENGQKTQKNWKDRDEYDLEQNAAKETDPNKKLDFLNTWKTKYPTSDFKELREQLFLATYVSLNKAQDAVNTAKDMLANDPKNFSALYYITLLVPRITPVTPENLDSGQKAATGLLANLDTKPATIPDAQWTNVRKDAEATGHTTLGWIAMQQKNNEVAESEFTKSLQVNPNASQVSYWLGTVILGEKNPEKQSAALYDFARAASYDGPGSLNPAGRAEIQTYLEKAYITYHGSKDGLDQLLAQAKTAALPAADFKVMSTADIAKAKVEKENALMQSDPSLALWKNLKAQLTGDNGQTYFSSNMKGAAIPGGVNGIKGFTGVLISEEPATHPKTLVLSVEDGTTPDATIKLAEALPGKADPGTKITFSGVADSFTANPFMITFNVEKKNLSGWTGKDETHHAPARRRRR